MGLWHSTPSAKRENNLLLVPLGATLCNFSKLRVPHSWPVFPSSSSHFSCLTGSFFSFYSFFFKMALKEIRLVLAAALETGLSKLQRFFGYKFREVTSRDPSHPSPRLPLTLPGKLGVRRSQPPLHLITRSPDV